MTGWEKLVVRPEASLRDAIACIDAGGLQLALIVDDGRLKGVVTDGDVRRAILKGHELTDQCIDIANPNPTTAPLASSPSELLGLMRQRVIHHVPLIDSDGLLAGVSTIDELIGAVQRPNWVVLMAGGLGQRLRPLTSNCPKPMLRIGGKPILETILDTFIDQGFRNFFFSVNYMASVVKEHFRDGSKWGVQIEYLHETERLGTAGSLRLLPEKPQDPIFVMNGDLLTRVKFDSMLTFHEEHDSRATMAVREYDFQVPYGVVRMNGSEIEKIDEKPVHRFYVNAGIYTLSPDVLDLIGDEGILDMPVLFQRALEAGRPTCAFPLREYWLDVGRIEEFERAQREWNVPGAEA